MLHVKELTDLFWTIFIIIVFTAKTMFSFSLHLYCRMVVVRNLFSRANCISKIYLIKKSKQYVKLS